MDQLILCGKLYDGIRDELQEQMEILIRGDTIEAVGRGLPCPEHTRRIDLRHLTVTPGLIDAHVHGNILRWQEMDHILNQSEGYFTLAYLHTAQRCLERGFTSIRVNGLGPTGFGAIDCRQLINRGFFAGARMVVGCHSLGCPGMPADMSMYVSANPLLSDQAQPSFVGSGPDFFANQVRREIKYGSDFIKIFLSGSFLSPDGGPEVCYLSEEELRAIIQTAHDLRKPVTAHVYPGQAMRRLLAMEIDGMEHGALMDEETARLFENSGAYLVPTFAPYQDIIEENEAFIHRLTADAQAKLRRYAPLLRASRQVIRDSSIRLGFGSDFCSVHQPYESCYEYRSWMRSGMGAFRTLKAATSVNAGILGIADQVGTVEPGKRADLAGWHRDLLQDPDALFECDFVMKDGVRCAAGNRVVE